MNPINILRARGFFGTLRKIKEKYLIRAKYIYTCEINPDPVGKEYQLVLAEEETLYQMYCQHQDELSQAKYELMLQRLESSTEECLLITHRDQVCGYCHSAYADHYNAWSNLHVKVEPGQVYLFDDYVFKAHRGRGLHKFSIARRLELAREKGCSSALTIIDKSNIPSHRAYTSQGFQRTQLIWYVPVVRKSWKVGKGKVGKLKA